MNVYAEKYPTVKDRYLVLYKDKVVATGDHLPSITKYQQANSGSELVDKVKGVKLVSMDEITKVLMTGTYDNKPVFADLDPPPTKEEVEALLTPVAKDEEEEVRVDVEEDVDEVPDLPTLDPGEPMNFKAEVHQAVFTPPVNDEAVKNVDPVKTGKRGRPALYNLDVLKVGDKIEYHSNLGAARTMACLTSKKSNKSFKVVVDGKKIFIVRKA